MYNKFPIKVLLVEDDAGDAELVLRGLRESRMQLFEAAHAVTLEQALKIIGESAIDAILLDLSLPDADGMDTVARMREAAPRLPIIVLTGYDNLDFANQIVELGAQDYLVKDSALEGMIVRATLYSVTRMHAIIEREEMLAHLSAAIETKKRLFGLLAHDLRNPIGVISGYAELLEMTLGERADDKAKAWIASIRDSTDFAMGLIKDVLSMAMSESSGLTLRRRPVDISKLAVKAIERNNILGQKKGVQVQLNRPPGGLPQIAGDPVKIDELLDNLIGNAIKFSHPGGKVRVSMLNAQDVVQVKVADQGVGVAPEVEAALFQPFCRGKRGTAGEGTNGLGLYICSQIANAHGGSIAVNSQYGEGAEFTVSLPVAGCTMESRRDQ